MLKELFVSGSYDGTLTIPSTKLDMIETDFVADTFIRSLKAGTLISVDTAGDVALANGDALGVLLKDAAGEAHANIPALASGRVTAIVGGCLIETDEVVEEDIVPGDKLYAVNGQFSKFPAVAADLASSPVILGSQPVALARSANSTTDKTLLINVY